jgi:hypothetical protein
MWIIAEEGVVGVCRFSRSPARIFTLGCTPIRGATRRARGNELCTVVAIAQGMDHALQDPERA